MKRRSLVSELLHSLTSLAARLRPEPARFPNTIMSETDLMILFVHLEGLRQSAILQCTAIRTPGYIIDARARTHTR
jgi:hypothetical protein